MKDMIGRKENTGRKMTIGTKTMIGRMTPTGTMTSGMKTNGMTKIGKQMDGMMAHGIRLMMNMNTKLICRQTSTAAIRHKSTIRAP